MANTVAKKLRIAAGSILRPLYAPNDFVEKLQPLPENVEIAADAKTFDQLHWFVTTKAQLEKELDKVLKLLTGAVICWTYYPKGTSKVQTDLTRDKGWDKLLSHEELQWISFISFDETWSVFGFRLKTEADKKKDAKRKVREIFNYIDASKKEIRLPDDLAAALDKHKKEHAYFQSLSFSNRKEYVEWIITAKREETRKQRVEGTIERLGKSWKNPRNM